MTGARRKNKSGPGDRESRHTHKGSERAPPPGLEVKEKPDEDLGKEHHGQRCNQRLSRELRKVIPIKYANEIQTQVSHPSPPQRRGSSLAGKGMLN